MAKKTGQKTVDYIVRHFKNTKNADLCARAHISYGTLHRIARENGLTKTRQFMRKCQRNTTEAAKRSHELNGTYPPKGFIIPNCEKGRFKKGETTIMRFGKKKNAIRLAKATATRNATIAKDRRRIMFGLPQQTRMKFALCDNKARSGYRNRLRSHGYMCERDGRVFYYDDETCRSALLEKRSREKFRFEFKEARQLTINNEQLIINDYGND